MKSPERFAQTRNQVKLMMNFEQFCSNSSISIFSGTSRSQSHHENISEQTTSSLKELPGNHATEKKKSKKKSKGNGGVTLGKRKRQQNRIRKSENQIQELINEFRINPEWSKEKVTDLSEKTGLSESQVYKWNWDQRKKFNLELDSIEAEVSRDEFGGYCCKKWGKLEEFENDDNICNLLGLDVNKMALDLVKNDLEKRQKTKPNVSHIDKSTPLIIKKKDNQQSYSTSAKMQFLHTPQSKQKQQHKELIVVQQCKEFLENTDTKNNHQLITTPRASYSRTTADSCQSWLASVHKSPVPLFEPQPFNVFSPWKYDSNHYQGPPNQSHQLAQFSLKMPQIVKSSPIKSPSKLYNNNWNFFSPMVEEKEAHAYISGSQYKSSCFLDFGSQD